MLHIHIKVLETQLIKVIDLTMKTPVNAIGIPLYVGTLIISILNSHGCLISLRNVQGSSLGFGVWADAKARPRITIATTGGEDMVMVLLASCSLGLIL